MRLLVVEDDLGIQSLLASLLQDEGYEVTLARSATDIVLDPQQPPPAVVLLDMHLPGGPEAVIDELRQRPGWTPVLAMSGSREDEHAEAIGAYAFLPKPFELDDVVRMVADGVQLFSAGQSLASQRQIALVKGTAAWSDQAIERMVRWAYPELEPTTDTPHAVLVADADSRYLDANRAAVQLLGFTVEELRELSVADIVSYERQWTAEEWSRYRVEGEWSGKVELRRKDGTRVSVQALAKTVDMPVGSVHISVLNPV
ncbi:MAG: response regulator [Chloroflexi bacterium]|nr:response regulator [Chloroflexota bacterium]